MVFDNKDEIVHRTHQNNNKSYAKAYPTPTTGLDWTRSTCCTLPVLLLFTCCFIFADIKPQVRKLNFLLLGCYRRSSGTH